MSTSSAPSLDLLSLGGNFLLVIALLLVLLWALRRLQGANGGQGLKGFGGLAGFRPAGRRMVLLETLSVGARQKIALIRVDGREVLVGITPTQFSRLDSWAVEGTELEDGAQGAKSATPENTSEAQSEPQRGRS